MKRTIKISVMALAAMFAMSTAADAQGLLGKLKDKAVKAAKKEAGKQAEKQAEKAVMDAVSGENDGQAPEAENNSKADGQSAQTNAGQATGNLGLPKNTDGPQPAEKSKADVSYTARITYPSHEQDIYYDGATKRQYAVRTDKPTERSIFFADSMMLYNIDDAKKTISITSMKGAEESKGIYKKLNHKKEVEKYCDRWCIKESYTAEERDAQGEVMQTSFEIWTDIETDIRLRENQNGGTMQRLSHIVLGDNPGKAFDMPQGYKVTRTLDIGQLMKDKAAAEQSDDPAKAAQDLMKNIGKYQTKPKKQ